MLFNKLFLGAILAMTSVAAIPNPAAEPGSLVERSKHHDHHDCGKHASYNEEKRECVCHASGETYHKKHKKCKKEKEDKKHKTERDVIAERSPKKHKDSHHCGKHASYNEEKKECVCHDSSEVFERKHKKCKKHISLRSILHHCGREAYYDDAKNECICHDSGKDFLKKHKTCACPQGEKWHHIERKCSRH
ncbi:qi74 protein [Fusarium langsethiae]|uniref:Qi74 protein n=1 Tax=Fusarium langsethiae TaxID=179993 RepID=A0A0N0DDF6_FUSLA|nr:qi74 protein [Fusarium langsethiae]